MFQRTVNYRNAGAWKRIWFNALLVLFCLSANLPAQAQQQVLRLWDGAAPGSEGWTIPEAVDERGNGQRIITNVRNPELSVYLPLADNANGAAVVLCPGGALRMLYMGGDDAQLISWLNDKGVAVFVLKYRTL